MKEVKEKLNASELQLRQMVDAYAEDVIKGKMRFYLTDEDESDEDIYEAYSIKYIVDQSGNLEDVIIMLAGGGPNIWLDTHAQEIQGFWGTTKYTKNIYDYQYIIDYFYEDYQCVR
jgi:hypothetical protein